MEAPEPFSYDRVHYPAKPYHVTRPDHLELFGFLFGMRPAPADEARVLEIGCGTGENVLLAAECFPRARFLGVDLSPSQIDAGRRTRAALGLDNIELRALDLTRIDDELGEFDYIVAHGVYSWVPESVREAMLEIMRRRLAPQGIAFVSANVKPGWFAKAMAGQMMRWHVRGLTAPGERAAAARRYLTQVIAGANPAERLYRATLAERAKICSEQHESAFYHDDLSEISDGCWFWELAERLGAHGLQYLADANAERLGPTGLAAETLEQADRLTNVIEREQHLDFLRNRSFRLTLACHQGIELDRGLDPGRLRGLHVGLDVAVEEFKVSASPAAPLVVCTRSTRMPIEEPLTKAALMKLGNAWPGFTTVAELAAEVGAADELAPRLLELFRAGVIALSLRPPSFTTAPPERPRACALARLQAEATSHVVNLRHTHSLLVEETDRRLLRALDGTRDRAALAAELGLEPAAVEAALTRLARMALLAPS